MKCFSKIAPLLFVLLLVLSFVSCASIIKGGSSEILISAEPNELFVEIEEVVSGIKVFEGKTPTNIELSRSFRYQEGNVYHIKIYQQSDSSLLATMELSASEVNGWYMMGNIIGILGWFFVDPVTGAMYSWETTLEIEDDNIKVYKKIRNRRNNFIHIVYDEEK